jgi:hypothetical protein
MTFQPLGQHPSSDPGASRKAFSRQTRRFRQLFLEALRQHGNSLGNTIASPKNVLSFAEDLIICPTEEAVTSLMRRDLEAARGVYIIAGDLDTSAGRGHVQFAIPVSQTETPFCLLAVS